MTTEIGDKRVIEINNIYFEIQDEYFESILNCAGKVLKCEWKRNDQNTKTSVTFLDAEHSLAAYRNLDNLFLDGRQLKIHCYHDQKDKDLLTEGVDQQNDLYSTIKSLQDDEKRFILSYIQAVAKKDPQQLAEILEKDYQLILALQSILDDVRILNEKPAPINHPPQINNTPITYTHVVHTTPPNYTPVNNIQPIYNQNPYNNYNNPNIHNNNYQNNLGNVNMNNNNSSSSNNNNNNSNNSRVNYMNQPQQQMNMMNSNHNSHNNVPNLNRFPPNVNLQNNYRNNYNPNVGGGIGVVGGSGGGVQGGGNMGMNPHIPPPQNHNIHPIQNHIMPIGQNHYQHQPINNMQYNNHWNMGQMVRNPLNQIPINNPSNNNNMMPMNPSQPLNIGMNPNNPNNMIPNNPNNMIPNYPNQPINMGMNPNNINNNINPNNNQNWNY